MAVTQFALALGQLFRHLGERSGKRGKFRRVNIPRRGGFHFTAADAAGGSGERTDRPEEQPLAEELRSQQGDQAGDRQLEIGERNVAVDAAEDLVLVNADEDMGIGAGQLVKSVDATDAVEAGLGHSPTLLRQCGPNQRMIGNVLASLVAAVRTFRDNDTMAVDQDGRGAGTVLDEIGKLRHPAELDRSRNDCERVAVGTGDGVARHDFRLGADPADDRLAQHEAAFLLCLLDIFAV